VSRIGSIAPGEATDLNQSRRRTLRRRPGARVRAALVVVAITPVGPRLHGGAGQLPFTPALAAASGSMAFSAFVASGLIAYSLVRGHCSSYESG